MASNVTLVLYIVILLLVSTRNSKETILPPFLMLSSAWNCQEVGYGYDVLFWHFVMF